MGSCRCKMCGGHIHYAEDASVATCEYCGTEQTIVKTDDLKKLSLFNRANTLRMQNEFDKAQLTYDNILIDDPNNAEAHWGICLCRYGIEYITLNNKKVPTCHRTIIKSIYDDLDYKETINNADVVAKKVYEAEAKEFDRIQKDILKISQKEQPYDIFISYKENDENNNRTKDSLMGEIIYNSLTNKGYRVFYSKIALKNKEPKDFEPIIFAALRSAKIMLAIGSKTEYFNSIWEKNEWARFLSFMQDDPNKYLIPCYFDMESFGMPDEFLVFEAIDLNDNNYLDVIFNRIEKLLNKKVVETAKESHNQTSNSQINNLLERVKYCLSEHDFNKANEVIENILNIDYKCAKAYYYKIFVNNNASCIDDFINKKISIDSDSNYKKALDFSDSQFKEQLVTINNNIKDSIISNDYESIYRRINEKIHLENYSEAIILANKILDYKDVKLKLEEIKEMCYQCAEKEYNGKNYDSASNHYKLIPNYKDSKGKYILCKKLVIKMNNIAEANKLCEAMDTIISKVTNNKKEFTNNDKSSYESYCSRLKFLVKDYADWMDKTKYYASMLSTVLYTKTIEDYEAKNRKIKTFIRYSIVPFIILILILTITISANVSSKNKKKKRYNDAINSINNKDYNTAYNKLDGLKYKDSLILFDLLKARNNLENNDYEKAIDIVYKLGGTTNVSYDSGEGSATKTDETIKMVKYINNDASATGREFVSWIIDSYKIDFNSYVLDLSLKANYKKIEYAITYNGLPTVKEYEKDKNKELPKTYVYEESGNYNIPDAIWDGYTFLGWTSDDNDSPTTNYSFPKNRIGDITLTANWKANEYMIYLDFDGGPEVDYTPIKATRGETFKLPQLGEREGYNFIGYGSYITDNRGYKHFFPVTDEEGNSLGNYNYAKDVTLKALWEGKNYKVTIKAGTGIITIPNSTQKTTDDERILPGENKVKTLKCGDEITLESYSAAYWYIDGVMVTRSVTYTLVVPAHDCTIETRSS